MEGEQTDKRKAYRESHKEQIKLYKKNYRQINWEQIQAYKKHYTEENRAEINKKAYMYRVNRKIKYLEMSLKLNYMKILNECFVHIVNKRWG